MTDLELLQEYAVRNSEEAFGTLANRYTSLVYSAALRQTGDHAGAEEITQAVFIILARKAAGFRADAILSGWLLRTTRFVALNARRRELHRRNLEQQAMSLYASETEAAWKGIAPLLDEALFSLSERDRNAVALRFFEQKSFKEIADAIGTTEDNAQKRVARAVEKLRSRFMKRGVVLPGALVAGAMSAHAVQAAPEGLAGAVSSAVVAGAAGAGLISSLADLTLAAWAAARLRNLALQGTSIVLMAVVIWLAALGLNRSRPRAAAIASPAASAGFVVAAKSRADVNGPADEPRTGPARLEGLRFRVVDSETQRPVAKARLTLVWTTDFPNHATNTTATDQQGTALLAIDRTPARDWDCRIEVFRDGYVPKYVSWSERQGDDPRDIPTEYATKLTPAVNIGAVVINEAFEPVPGARVVFDVPKYRAPAESLDRERLTMTSRYHVELTDSQGRWHCSHVPQQFGIIDFQVAHPDYAPVRFGAGALGPATNNGTIYLAEADLRNETAVMLLRHGAVAAGMVVDELGSLVGGAKVTSNCDWAEPTASQWTGPDGRFRFANISSEPRWAPPESTISFLTVQAEGYSPEDFRFNGPVPPAESRFTLSRGAVLRGRVVDESGRPVPKATVQVCSHSNAKRFEWTATTDADGRFEWLSAPPKPEFYVVDARGYQPLPEVQWAADGAEHLVTLRTIPPPVRIFGTAVDDASGKPLGHFEVWMSFTENIHTGYGKPMTAPRPLRLRASGNSGQFAFTNHDVLATYTLEVRAEGYCPSEVSGRGAMTNDSRFDFRLEPASPLSGQVRLPDGRPVAGAVAMLMTDKKWVYMKLPGQFDLKFSGADRQETDAQGWFSFPPTSGATNIVVFSPAGFASATPKALAASPVVTLLPWGRVEGVLKIGSQPGANETIGLALLSLYGERTGYSVFLQGKTDAEGRFAFEGVPPLTLQISHRLSFRDGQAGTIPQSQMRQFQVQAGQTTFVTLGGTGCKVVGKLMLGGGRPAQQINWQLDVQTLETKPAGVPAAPEPGAFASAAEFQAARKAWLDAKMAFWQSEAGREAQRNRRSYVLVFDKDGSFKIDDVEPGTYELKIRLSDPGKPAMGFGGSYEALGTLTKAITIPEPVSGQEAGTFDLGLLEAEIDIASVPERAFLVPLHWAGQLFVSLTNPTALSDQNLLNLGKRVAQVIRIAKWTATFRAPGSFPGAPRPHLGQPPAQTG